MRLDKNVDALSINEEEKKKKKQRKKKELKK